MENLERGKDEDRDLEMEGGGGGRAEGSGDGRYISEMELWAIIIVHT